MGDVGMTSIEHGGWQVDSNTSTPDQLKETLKTRDEQKAEETGEKPDISKAASDLGKKGGKAAAEKRKEAKEAEPDAGEPEKSQKAKGADVSVEEPEKAEKSQPENEPDAQKAAEEDKPKDKRGDPRHDPVARMREATRKEAEAKRERDAIKAEFERLKAEHEAIKAGPKQEEVEHPQASSKPRLEDYEGNYEAYLDARDNWNREQWSEEYRRQSAVQAQESALDLAVDKFRSVAADCIQDCSAEVQNLRTEFQLHPGERPSGENWIANELVFSPEQAPTLMLHFTEHPDELQRIAALTTPRAVSREMAKLEARLEAATTGEPSPEREKEVSKAPPPIKPVSGAPYVADSDEFKPGMSLDEYSRVWKKLQKAGRR